MNIIGRYCRCVTIWCFKTAWKVIKLIQSGCKTSKNLPCRWRMEMFPWLKSVKVPQKEVPRSRRSQSCDRSYAHGLSWVIRVRWCHHHGLGGNRGSTGWAVGLTAVQSLSVRVTPMSRSDSMEMQPCASDKDRRRNHIIPTSPASHLIFSSACFSCLGSSARAANSSAEQGEKGRQEGRVQKKVWDKSATVHFTMANRPDLNDHMTGNKDISQLR